jgi:hypothetical protein
VTTDTKDKTTFCAENPDLSICKTSTFAGSCSSTSCSGDAIQCAIAQTAARSECEFLHPTGADVDTGTAALSGGDRPTGHPGNSPDIHGFSGLIDQSDPLSGGCPADLSLTLLCNPLSVPISKICEPAAILGNLMVGFSLLAAAFIVFKQ